MKKENGILVSISPPLSFSHILEMTASDGLHSFYKTDMTQKIAMYLVF